MQRYGRPQPRSNVYGRLNELLRLFALVERGIGYCRDPVSAILISMLDMLNLRNGNGEIMPSDGICAVI
jgi:hypothetical protein